MRKFQAALCGLLILAVQLFMPTAALAAAGDVASHYETETRTQCIFVAFTTAATSAACDVSRTVANNHTLQVVVTGAPAGGVINLNGSVDGVNYSSISGNQTCTSTCEFHVAARPVNSIKVVLSSDSGGTAPTWTAFYVGVK